MLQDGRLPAPVADERMLSAILHSVHEAVITVDREHRIFWFNRAAERLVGLPADAVVGRDCREVLKASFGPAQSDCPMGDLAEGGKPRQDVDGTLVRADGRIVPISASWAFFEDDRGDRLGFVLSFRSFEEIERIAEERKSRFPYREIVGKTPAIRRLFDLIDVVKETDSTVLILGESGTGKGVFARAIHDLSARKDRPFGKVSCTALTETLLESELFGHVRGAFTGAISDKVGRFEAAEGGTVFLDEVGEISPALQVKLLRVLQEREFERVGSSRTVAVDVRVIAATHRDLKEEMRAGRFREDLYYRLNVIPIFLPPLRERKEDLPLLADHVLKKLRARGLDRIRAVSPEAMRCLMEYPWPGNIRELENVLERGAVISRGPVLALPDLPPELQECFRPVRSGPGEAVPAGPEAGAAADRVPPVGAAGAEGERDTVLRALETARWNRGQAARTLGIDRSTLWRKMRRLGIEA